MQDDHSLKQFFFHFFCYYYFHFVYLDAFTIHHIKWTNTDRERHAHTPSPARPAIALSLFSLITRIWGISSRLHLDGHLAVCGRTIVGECAFSIFWNFHSMNVASFAAAKCSQMHPIGEWHALIRVIGGLDGSFIERRVCIYMEGVQGMKSIRKAHNAIIVASETAYTTESNRIDRYHTFRDDINIDFDN